VEAYRTAAAKEKTAPKAYGTLAAERPPSIERRPVRAALRYSMADVAPGDGLRLGYDLLATAQGLAKSACLGSSAPSLIEPTTWGRKTGFLTGHSRQFIDSRHWRGKKSGPNPTDRRRAGSKHHILTEARGIPIAVILTKANRNDITQAEALLKAVPPICGKRGAPLRKPRTFQADRAYDSKCLRARLRRRRITPQIARRRTAHGSGLGKTRWVVERTFAWLHQFRRLRIRFERLASMHEAFLKLGCCLICWRFVRKT
jgi:transposase